MFKLALDAGHGIKTAKGCIKSLDPNETREWTLNARIAEKVEAKLKDYTGYELLRTDDRTGAKDVAVKTRTDFANRWGADFFLSIHHNGGVKGGKGGGIVAYVYTKVGEETKAWQKALYDNLIRHTGLRGNRSTPLNSANFHVCRETKMPAVLLELGFMDSSTDVPIILTETYAEQCADAIVEVLVQRGGLKRKPKENTGKIYRVQVGAYSERKYAEAQLKELKAAGFTEAYIREG